MIEKQTYTIPPQKSAGDTSNWDDRGFAILRPNTTADGKPVPSLALMRPDPSTDEFSDIDSKVE